jgi:type IV secretory pathway VirB10-like protein
MLAKKPEDRYPTAEAVLADLQGLDRGRIPAAPARTAPAAPTRWKRKQILAAGGAAAACLIAAFAFGAMASRNGDPVKPAAPPPAVDTPEDSLAETSPPPPPPATPVAKDPEAPPAPPGPPPDSKVIVAPLTIEQAGAAIDSSIPQQPPEPPPPPPRTGRRGSLRGEDGFRPRPGPGRGEGMMGPIRKLPREPEAGTREALKAARGSLKKNEPMAAVSVLRASRRMHASYIDEHPDVKTEYEKLTREAMSKIPPAMRRQLEETRGRFGRGRGGPPAPP